MTLLCGHPGPPAAEASSLADARHGLRRMAALLRAAGVGHAALHDLLVLYASVQRWVGLADSAAFNPTLANVRGVPPGPATAGSQACGRGAVQQAGGRCAQEAWIGPASNPPVLPTLPAQGEEGERYRPQFLWALLSFWYRAGSSADPTTWVSPQACQAQVHHDGRMPASPSCWLSALRPHPACLPAAHERASRLPESARGGVQLPAGECLAFLSCPPLLRPSARRPPLHALTCGLLSLRSLAVSQVFSTGGYVKQGHRQALLQHLAGAARAAWPHNGPFTFRNPRRQALGRIILTVENLPPVTLGHACPCCWLGEAGPAS